MCARRFLRPRRFVVPRVEGLFLAVADPGDAVRLDAVGRVEIDDRLGALLAESHIVFVRAALVAVPLDEDPLRRDSP